MGLNTEDNCYVHNLLFADHKVVITRGVEDANYIARKLEEEYEKWGQNKLWKNGIFRYGSFRGIANQWE
jgi:hypothetical protein